MLQTLGLAFAGIIVSLALLVGIFIYYEKYTRENYKKYPNMRKATQIELSLLFVLVLSISSLGSLFLPVDQYSSFIVLPITAIGILILSISTFTYLEEVKKRIVKEELEKEGPENDDSENDDSETTEIGSPMDQAYNQISEPNSKIYEDVDEK